jgi:hypothetical protein
MPVKDELAPNRWEHFPHGPDVGIRGRGTTLAEAFEQAGLALTGIVTDAQIEPQTPVEVSCNAPDIEMLLVEWLNAIISVLRGCSERVSLTAAGVNCLGATALHLSDDAPFQHIHKKICIMSMWLGNLAGSEVDGFNHAFLPGYIGEILGSSDASLFRPAN